MHYRLLVLFNKEDATTSLEARQHVYNTLLKQGFAAEPTRFSSPPADWYSVGGRWSGIFTLAALDQAKVAAFENEFEKRELQWSSPEKSEAVQREATIALFREFFPDFEGEPPIWRDTFELDGYEDDAVIVTEELWKVFLAEHETADSEVRDEWGIKIVDLDYDPILPEISIGKWIVVVDYHN